ncbi:DNA methyltransferase [Ferriphaselus sp. R-1]|uniref:DNA methyltransferase n=1 Tax=Ferriphaselus sp. R-1 TaxID=1485544 RepID=UPI0009DFC48F|nr:DNA methyltransferase [Ferriphaselus sp. R-1]
MESNNSMLLDRPIESGKEYVNIVTNNVLSQQGKPMNAHSELSNLVPTWEKSCTSTESTLHQLSPYIGKLKSSIAHDLIQNYSAPGDLVADVFAGSGTVLLEAVKMGRRAFGVDSSPYAALLSRAKLSAPNTLDEALIRAKKRLEAAALRPVPDRRRIPEWVRNFFHPNTLSEVVNFSKECKEQGDDFLLACMLGILHHQRPGFLSFPSSHLTPYLRDKKFPRDEFPLLYQYRELAPRLLAKIERTYKRKDFVVSRESYTFVEGLTENVPFPTGISCLITSPPYMNALDYGRDNRLRLWFVDKANAELIDNAQSQQRDGFESLMATVAMQATKSLVHNGYCIVIVGDQIKRNSKYPLSSVVQNTFAEHAPSLNLTQIIVNSIPDIRRARRDHRGVRTENFLIFKKEYA